MNRAVERTERVWFYRGYLESDTKPTFPSEYFNVPNKKPKVSVPNLQGTFLDLEALVFAKVTTGTIDGEEACCYLWHVYGHIVGTLKEDWKSFGTTIGTKGAEVSVQDILDAETKASRSITATAGEGGYRESARLYILLLLLAPYKIHLELPEKRKRMLSRCYDEKIRTVMPRGYRMLSLEFVNGFDRPIWKGFVAYSTLVAALDMFLTMFPDHPFAILRIGTETSRFKDCVPFDDEGFFQSWPTERVRHSVTWLWNLEADHELYKAHKKGEEVGCPHSYAPYLSSMHLVRRSPYAAYENRFLHMFVHTVGCIMGEERSFNVPLIESALVCIHRSAFIVGYALSARNWCRNRARNAREPQSLNSFEWISYMQNLGDCYLPRYLVFAVYRKLISNPDSDPNTVGWYLKEQARDFLRPNRYPF